MLKSLALSLLTLSQIAFAAPASLDALLKTYPDIVVMKDGDKITGLNFRGLEGWKTDKFLTAAQLGVLADLPDLTTLFMSGVQFDEAGYEKILKVKSLKYFEFGRSFIKNDALKRLVELPNLLELNLVGSELDDTGLTALAALKNLTGLWLWNSRVADFSALANFKNLTILGVGNTFDDADADSLVSLGNLREIRFVESKITGAGLKKLGKLPLIYLGLASVKLSAADLKELGAFTTLRQVELPTTADDTTLEALAASKNLYSIFAGGAVLKGAGFKALAGYKNLQILTLKGTHSLTEEGITALAAIPAVRELSLMNSRVTNDSLKEISKLTELRSLNLAANSPITSLANLKGLPNLEYLSLFSLGIDGADFTGLENMPKLKTLIADTTQFSDDGLAHVKPLLELSALSLDNTKITDAGLKVLTGKKSLRELSVIGTGLTDASIDTFLTLEGLEKLELTDTAFTADLLRLTKLPKLKTLALSDDLAEDEDFVKKFKAARPDVSLE